MKITWLTFEKIELSLSELLFAPSNFDSFMDKHIVSLQTHFYM